MFTTNTRLSTDLSTAIPQEKNLFVVLVHFGESAPTDRLIASLLKGSLVPSYIIIVDHAEQVYLLRIKSNAIVYVRPNKNNGYAAGLRAGITHAGSIGVQSTGICVCVNNDIEFGVSDIQNIALWWNAYGSPCTFAGPAMGAVSLITGRSRIYHKNVEASFFSLEYIHGSCMVGQYGLFSKMPFFEHLFMYWEDVAISRSIVAAGGVLAYIPNLQMHHDDTVGALSSKKLYYLVRNGAYALQHNSPYIWRQYWRILNIMRLAYHQVHTGKKHAVVARALRDAQTLSPL